MGIRHWQQLSLTHFLCVEDKKQNKKRIRQVRNLNTESNSWEFQQHINKSSTGGGIFLLLCAFKHCELKEVNRRCGAICLLLLRSKVVTREKKNQTMPKCPAQAPRLLLYFCEVCNSVPISSTQDRPSGDLPVLQRVLIVRNICAVCENISSYTSSINPLPSSHCIL